MFAERHYGSKLSRLNNFGFHIRKANINIIRKSYSDLEEASFGRGLAYHIIPKCSYELRF